MRVYDIAFQPELAEAASIESTPTVVVRDSREAEGFRAMGVPTLDQVLAGADLAVAANMREGD